MTHEHEQTTSASRKTGESGTGDTFACPACRGQVQATTVHWWSFDASGRGVASPIPDELRVYCENDHDLTIERRVFDAVRSAIEGAACPHCGETLGRVEANPDGSRHPEPVTPVVLCVRHPDHATEYAVDGAARVIDVDLGSSFDIRDLPGGADRHEVESWIEAHRAEVADLPETSPVRRDMEAVLAEVERLIGIRPDDPSIT